MDGAQDLTDEQLEALLPTICAAPSGDPQQIYTGRRAALSGERFWSHSGAGGYGC